MAKERQDRRHQAVGRPTKREIANREVLFLIHYFDEAGQFYMQQKEAGLAAGFRPYSVMPDTTAVLERYSAKPFAECIEAVGLNRMYLATKLRAILADKETKSETKIMAMRMLLNNLGEKTADSSTTLNINTPKAMVIIGTDPKRIAAMLHPQSEIPETVTPELTPEEIN